jgi:hypothetical protein
MYKQYRGPKGRDTNRWQKDAWLLLRKIRKQKKVEKYQAGMHKGLKK